MDREEIFEYIRNEEAQLINYAVWVRKERNKRIDAEIENVEKQRHSTIEDDLRNETDEYIRRLRDYLYANVI